MIRSKKLVLIFAVCALQVYASPSEARGHDACRTVVGTGAAGGRSVVLRNPGNRQVTLSLSFQPASDLPTPPIACANLSLAGGSNTGRTTLAALCPTVPFPQDGVLKACIIASVVLPPAGIATGDLGSDLLGNNLHVAGH